jgi:hypothetical protein
MINDIVLPDMTLNEWKNSFRKKVKKRIEDTMGIPPKSILKPEYKIIEKYQKHDLEHWRIKYRVLSDEWCQAIMVFPQDMDFSKEYPCVLTIHGTTHAGKYGCVDPQRTPDRAYGIELPARGGYIAFSPDQVWFGDWWKEKWYKDVKKKDTSYIYDCAGKPFLKEFFKKYPKWSLDGRRVWDLQRAIDLIGSLDFIQSKNIGAIGNSLGGRSVIYLAAMEERLKAAVASTGISPNITNVFRNTAADVSSSPLLNAEIQKTGKPVFEYQEMMALCAPRALLMLEPFNDAYNPYIHPVLECFEKASKVFTLYNKNDHLSILVHGEGHNTPSDMREYAYKWFDRFLKK